MNIQELLQSMAERVSASSSVKNVYGDPVVVGNRTVIPAAQVRYAFGGGGGAAKGDAGAQNGGGVLNSFGEGGRLVAFVRGCL